MKSVLALTLIWGLMANNSQSCSSREIDYQTATSNDGNPRSYSNQAPSSLMLQLARSASEGAGFLNTDRALCYKGVKQIIADAFGKDLNCVRKVLSSGAAKDAGNDLTRAGFVNDMSQCKQPGVIRVYKGNKMPGYNALPGDTYGHIEVIGEEGMYHSFNNPSSAPIDERMRPPGRRVLTGCYVPDASKIRSSPLSSCPAGKSLKNPSYQQKTRGQSR